MIYTTLNKIRKHSPCESGWKNLLNHLNKTKADDEPLGFDVILESNGLDDALWCLRSVPEESRRWRLLAVRFAHTVDHLMVDQRSKDALEVAERHAYGLATDEELDKAGAAAREAAGAAAWEASWEATAAAWAAANAALEAAWEAALEAALEAAWAAANAAGEAANAAGEKQKQIFLQILDEDLGD